jgi:hypothetical protein
MAVLAALWGASYMFIKFAIEDLSDLALVFFRIALGALILAPVALRSGALPAVRRHLGWLTLIAVVQIMVPFLLITIGEHHVSSSLTGILVASAPIFTVLIAMVAVKDESVHGWSLAGIFVGMAGVALLFGLDLGGDSQALLGGLAILLASVGYAIGALIARRKLSGVPPIGVAGSIMGISTVLLLPTLPWSIAASSTPGPRHDRLDGGARGGRHRHRLPHLLHAQRRDRPGPRIDRRLHRAGVLDRLRRGVPRRVVHRVDGGRDAAHPRRLVDGRAGQATVAAGAGAGGQPKRTFPFERARACARSMKSSRLTAARNSRATSRSRALSERRSSRPCLASRPKSTVAAIAYASMSTSARARLLVGRLAHELGVGLARGLERALVGLLVLVDEPLDRAGGGRGGARRAR